MRGLLGGSLEYILERGERFGEIFGQTGWFDFEFGETDLSNSISSSANVM